LHEGIELGMNYLIIAAAFLAAIGILVAVHEFGHYWVAKKLGFKVLRFSIGFGRPLFTRVGRDADHTEYCIAAIPLGGYVKLLDEREGDVDPAELHRSFTRRPIAHRIAVLIAGPVMNLLFAALLYAVLAMVGTEAIKPFVSTVRPDSPASIAGLRAGDEIVRVGDSNVADTEELQIALLRQFSRDGVIGLAVRRDGNERALTVHVTGDYTALTEPGMMLTGLGFDTATWRAEASVKDAPAGSAGAAAGLRAGDVLLAVDGHALANGSQFIDAISAAAGHKVSIEIDRGGVHQDIVAAVPTVNDHGKSIGRLGIMLREGVRSWPAGMKFMRRSGPLDALLVGVEKTWSMSALTVQILWRMVTGEVSTRNISGVITIAEFAGISALLGVTAYLSFLAVISLSLGLLNLLPVPLLDGGQVMFQVAEAIKGSPISERVQILGQKIGIALLVMLVSLSLYNDISRHLN
jgi:regulator of sigma E protease